MNYVCVSRYLYFPSVGTAVCCYIFFFFQIKRYTMSLLSLSVTESWEDVTKINTPWPWPWPWPWGRWQCDPLLSVEWAHHRGTGPVAALSFQIRIHWVVGQVLFRSRSSQVHIHKAGFRRVERSGKSGRRDDQFIFAVGKIPTWHPLDFTTGFWKRWTRGV